MEDKEETSPSGVIVKEDAVAAAPDSYCLVPRTETQNANNPNSQFLGPTPVVAPSGSGLNSEMMKKKRGRPRKYGPDGSLTAAAAAATLSPMPISSSVPLAGEFSGWKRGRGRSIEPVKKSQKLDFETSGNPVSNFVGANFMPHVITVNPGEDVTMKVMSFSQRGSRAICILSANGTISNVTLRQPTTSGGTLTYEGRFEILSLTGSFTPTENGGTKGRSGGMSVSLAGPDGRVVGGCLAGLLIAAGPVQVIVGSFILGHQTEHKQKKPRAVETATPPAFTITTVNPISSAEPNQSYGGAKPIQKPSSFHFENPVVQGYTANSNVDDNNNSESSSLGDESRDTNSQSNCELSS